MSVLRKAATFARVAKDGNLALLRDRALTGVRGLRLRLQGPRPFVFRRSGFRAVCHPDWPQSCSHFCSAGEADDLEMRLVISCLRPGDWFVDGGANLGLYAFAALAAVGADGGVVAVDADADACRRLEVAFGLLGAASAAVVHAALTDHDGEVTFHVSENRVRSDIQSLRPNAEAISKGLRPVVVPARTLEDIGSGVMAGKTPRAVKLDIEGAEVDALRACPAGWLGPDGPLWIVEINPACLAEFGRTPGDVVDFFAREFDCFVVPKFPRPGTVSRPRRLAIGEKIEGALFYNLIAVPGGQSWRQHKQRIISMLESS